MAGSGGSVAGQWCDLCPRSAFGFGSALAAPCARGTLCSKSRGALHGDQTIAHEGARAGSARTCNRNSARDASHSPASGTGSRAGPGQKSRPDRATCVCATVGRASRTAVGKSSSGSGSCGPRGGMVSRSCGRTSGVESATSGDTSGTAHRSTASRSNACGSGSGSSANAFSASATLVRAARNDDKSTPAGCHQRCPAAGGLALAGRGAAFPAYRSRPRRCPCPVGFSRGRAHAKHTCPRSHGLAGRSLAGSQTIG